MELFQAMDRKLDNFATESQAMSEATVNFTTSLLQDLSVNHIVRTVIQEKGEGQTKKYPWREKEHEADGQPGCKLILEEEILPMTLNGCTLRLFDIRSRSLPELKAGKRKSNGFSDLALGLQESMAYSSVHAKELMLSYTNALVELKTKKADLKPGQLMLQLVSLSLIAGNGQGVVVLGTDCMDKWQLLHFSEYNSIVVQPYTHGNKCLADFKTLVAESLERKEKYVPPARLPIVHEDSTMDVELRDFEIEETNKDKALERESKLRKFALALGSLYGETPEVPSWAKASESCSSYYS